MLSEHSDKFTCPMGHVGTKFASWNNIWLSVTIIWVGANFRGRTFKCYGCVTFRNSYRFWCGIITAGNGCCMLSCLREQNQSSNQTTSHAILLNCWTYLWRVCRFEWQGYHRFVGGRIPEKVANNRVDVGGSSQGGNLNSTFLVFQLVDTFILQWFPQLLHVALDSPCEILQPANKSMHIEYFESTSISQRLHT